MLVFGRDGARTTGPDGDVPLDVGDPGAILPHLGAAIAFDEGLTAGQLMRCLHPWAGILSHITGSDIGDWASTAGGPQIRLAPEIPRPDGEGLAAVVLRPVLVLSREDEATYLTPQWRATCRAQGRDGTSYAVPADPFSWSHLPLVLETRATVEDYHGIGEVNGLCGLNVEPTFCDAVLYGFLEEVAYEGTVAEAIANEAGLSGIVAALADGDA